MRCGLEKRRCRRSTASRLWHEERCQHFRRELRWGIVRHNPSCGFTFIELVITVAIVGLLASLALPLSEVAVQRSKEQELRTNLREIRDAIDAYKQAVDDQRIARNAGETGYPKTLDVLVQGVNDAKSPKPAKIYFLRRVPRDPFSTDPDKPAAETWGKRSYASPPDEPRDGDDVYDVYSLSTGTGLNGVPHRQW
jgi:general secretion pathway protein G